MFRTHQFFSENAIFFLWNLGTHPHFYGKFTFTKFSTLWFQKPCLYSVFYSVIPVFLMSFWVFELYKHLKSWKTVHFRCSFSRKGQKSSLIHHGKNLQDHWKNVHFGLLGTHQISICSANFCLTPPRKTTKNYENSEKARKIK